MKIAIDARWIFPELSGIGTYTRELIRHLAAHDRTNEYHLFFHRRSLLETTAVATSFNAAPNFTAKLLPYDLFSLRGQLVMPGLLSDLRIDLYHAPNYMVPLLAFPPSRLGHPRLVVNLHDLIPLKFPNHAPKSKKARLFPLFKRIMFEVGRRAHLIITGSQASRRDILELLRIPAERHDDVVVIPDGVSERYQPGATLTGEVKTILYVGRPDPYKNLTGLVEAFARLREQGHPAARLRIIGPDDPRYPEARELARRLGVDDGVEWSGYVSDDELVTAYQQANVLVLPSRYEGFGLPVVEAMACGTPVICSNTSSLPEVAGTAAILFDPEDTDALVRALLEVFEGHGVARKMRNDGLQQAAQFTWARCAEQTLAAYTSAFGTGRSMSDVQTP